MGKRIALVCVLGAVGLWMDAASAIMTTPGSFQTSNGAGTYTIPIRVPPGSVGLQPDLSLSYSSESADGTVGVGFGIGGFPSISRCGATMIQDGIRGSVTYESSDRFCYNGQRLVLVSGTYGASGSEYRTEVDSFTKIVAQGSAGNGPSYFQVRAKSGQVMEFGNTADSKIEATGRSTVRVWAMNRLADTVGNYMSVTYSEDTVEGDFVPSRVDYGGNSSSNRAHYASVRFEYASSSGQVRAYTAGSWVKQSKRLTAIKTYVDSSVTREYTLAYEDSPATNRKRLMKVTECASGECLSPVSFTWTGTSLANPKFVSRYATPICANGSSSFGGCNDHDNVRSIRYADINGDGRADLCFRSDSGIRCLPARSGPSSNWPDPWDTSAVIATDICANNSTAYGECDDEDNWNSISFGDINGDGKADLMYRGDRGLQIWFSTGTGFSNNQSYTICAAGSTAYGICNDSNNWQILRLVDVTGDGRADFCYRSDSGVRCSPSVGTGFDHDNQIVTSICADPGRATTEGVCNDDDNFNTIAFSDITGDGRSDLIYRGDQGGMHTYISTGTSFINHHSTNFCIGTNGSGGCSSVRYADVNGDGLIDLCNRGGIGVNCANATGDGGFVSGITSQICGNGSTTYGGCNDSDNYNTIAYNPDVNGDGRSDLVYRGDQGIQVWTTGATSFGNWISYTICANDSSAYGVCNDDDNYDTIEIIDINGDAIADLVYRGDQGVQAWLGSGGYPDLLSSISSGIGQTTTVTYKPLTDSSIYTKGAGAVYPTMDVQFASYAVAVETTSDGIGGILTTTYKYGGMRSDVQGRGSLGFAWIEVEQADSGVRVRTDYSQSWPSVGLATLVQKWALNNTRLLMRMTNNYQCIDPSNGSACTTAVGKRYFPYLRTSNVESWDLNNATFPSVSTTNTYDSYGNATQISVTRSDGFSQSTVSTYANDTTNWRLGQLLTTRVTNTTPW